MVGKFLESWHCKNTGLLAIRFGLGIVFLAHGIGKIANIDSTIGFFAQLGLPAFLAWTVALIETIFGFGMILGVFTKLGGILLAFIMLVAIVKVKFPQGGFMNFELELMLLLSALGISFTGPGKYAIGNSQCGCVGGACPCSTCNDGCGCSKCNSKCSDCENCKDENCNCKVCKNK